MPWEQVAEGSVWSLGDIGEYEDELLEGSRNLLELDLRLPVSQGVVSELESILRDAGVTEMKVTTASPMIKIYWRKGFPWLPVIAAAVLGLIVLAVMIVGWRLLTYIGAEAPGAIPLLLLAGIALGVIGLMIMSQKSPIKGGMSP